MEFLCYCLFVAGIVAADQITKALVVARIALYADVPFLPGILQLTYVQNNGAAFSSFSGQQWLFALIFLVFTGLILWEYFRKKAGFTPFERWCIAAVYGGGLANMIDRIRLGYVVDFIYVSLINFPIFNVADMCIVVSIIIFAFLFLFIYKEEDLSFLNFKQKKYREVK